MQLYNLNIIKAMRAEVPLKLRKARRYALVATFAQPLIDMYNRFVALRSESEFYLSYNGQQASMQKLLNDVWPAAGGAIYIETVNATLQVFYLPNAEDNQPPIFLPNAEDNEPPIFLPNAEDFILQYDFIVWVPATLVFDEPKMRNLINRYRLAGKRYTIQTY